MFSLLCVCVCVFLFVCLGGLFVCVECLCVCVFLYVFLSFSFRRFMFLMHCTIFFFRLCLFFVCFHFVSVCCFVFSSLYRSLNILFVLLITGCFCLRSRIYSPQQMCFFCFVLWVIHVCVCLVDGVFFYDPLRTRCCVHCLWFLFAVFVWVLFTHSLSFKYLDQRVGFFHCFLMISFCCFA